MRRIQSSLTARVALMLLVAVFTATAAWAQTVVNNETELRNTIAEDSIVSIALGQDITLSRIWALRVAKR